MQPLASEGSSSPFSQPQPVAQPLVEPPNHHERRKKLDHAHSEARRQSAWRARHSWQGIRLQPWSMGRDDLWAQLCELDVPLPAGAVSALLDVGHARKLLFLAAHGPELFEACGIEELLEKAEAWSNQSIPREKALEALALARQIRTEATCCRARLKPTGGKRAGLENSALPLFEASYYTMLAAALQGTATRAEMKWHIPMAEGDSLIHGWWIMSGHATLWTSKESSEAGRWFAEFRAQHQRRS